MKKYLDWPLTILMGIFMILSAPLVLILVLGRNIEKKWTRNSDRPPFL